MPPKPKRHLVLALLFALLVACLGAIMPSGNALDGLHYDLMLAQNNRLIHAEIAGQSRHVAVVAVDEATLAAFGDQPRIFFGPRWAGLIDILAGANAKAIGFDLVFAYPDDLFQKNWEQSFFSALSRNQPLIVLGRTARSTPHQRFQAVFSFADPGTYIGAIELTPDFDGIVRSIPVSLGVLDKSGPPQSLPGFVNLLLGKAGLNRPASDIRLAPQRPILGHIPTYSLLDLLSCAENGDQGLLSEVFSGRIVVVGTTLKGEDESKRLDRFMVQTMAKQSDTAGDNLLQACKLDGKPGQQPQGSLIPSIYLHAAALDQVSEGRTVREMGTTWRFGISAAWCLLVSVLVIRRSLVAALISVAAVLLTIHSGASAFLEFGYWYPSAGTLTAVLLCGLGTYAIRFAMADQARKKVRRLFNYYLSDILVDQMLAQESSPNLGGDLRQVTVLFADLSGFGDQSDRLDPATLMTISNAYLSIIAEAIEEHLGYVDKFIGDEVMAIWGAPVDNPDHASDAVKAAMAISERIKAKMEADTAINAPRFDVKIAINSGPAIVGNVGSQRRLSYSAVGRTVTIAARLMSYASEKRLPLVLGKETADRVCEQYDLELVATEKLKGISVREAIYAPVSDIQKPVNNQPA